jgi:hypothetical protein
MNLRHRLRYPLTLVGVLVLSALAAAQAPLSGNATPLSNIGGVTGQEMRNIYNSSIGRGYSVGSLNSIAMDNARARVGYFGQQTATPQPRISFTPGSSPSAKPFSSFSPAPTTSPYLNLFREDFGGNSDLNYNTLVRPQLQQQAFNQQLQRQGQEMARRMQSIAAKSDFNPQGDKNQLPTGHQTAFGYYGHFHPTAAYRHRR